MPAGSARPRLLFLHPKTLVDSWPMPIDTLGEYVKMPTAAYPVLASAIRHLPYEIEIFDGYMAREVFGAYKRRLSRADLIAITVMSPYKALDTQLTIGLIRRLNPRARILLGGNQATAFPERWIELGADFVVLREGEEAFPALLEHLAGGSDDFSEIPNLVYRGPDGAPLRSRCTAEPISLDDSPLPAWELMNLRPYSLGMKRHGGYTATLEISRGCPFRCDFCNINRFWGYKQRYKGVDRVIEELERLYLLGVREFFVSDDNFGFDLEHTTAVLEEMVRRDWGFKFACFVRGDTIYRNPDFAALAARAGLGMGFMGIETLKKEWLKTHRKGLGNKDPHEMYTAVYETLKRNGIFLTGFFISDFESVESSGAGADGYVCDFHYEADLLPQKGSLLFENLAADSSVQLKDMFYHDWNMPPRRVNGEIQGNRKSFKRMLQEFDGYAARGLFSRNRMLRWVWWRHVGVLIERLLCTTRDDLRRYRWAKDDSLPIEERQARILASVLDEGVLEKLVRARYWKGPLALRTGLWTEKPPPPPPTPPAPKPRARSRDARARRGPRVITLPEAPPPVASGAR